MNAKVCTDSIILYFSSAFLKVKGYSESTVMRFIESVRGRLGVILFFGVVAFIFVLPIFHQINNWGIQDWDQHLFYHAVPRATILEYRQIPLWNPYYVGGTVLLANPQSRFLSPSFFLILVFGEVIGIKIEIWLYLVVGLLGAYELARQYKLGTSDALMSSFVFMLSSMYVLNLTAGMTWFLAVSYLPWAFLFYLKAQSDSKYALVSGLFLTLMFFGGGAYPLAVTILFLVLYSSILISFKEFRVLKAIKTLYIVLVFALCLGAIKFVPAAEFLQEHPRHIYDYSGFSLNSLFFGLFSRDQTLAAIAKLPVEQHGFVNGVTGGMDENGMYIGIIPFLLFLLGIGLHDKLRMFLLLCFVTFLWISFGNRPRLELWSMLHLLPVYNSMRIAQRFRIVFMLCLALFAGFGLQTVRNSIAQVVANRNLVQFVTLLILLGVLVDLLIVNSRVLQDAFPIPPLETAKSEEFYQVWELPSYDSNGFIISGSENNKSAPSEAHNSYGMYTSFGALMPAFLSNIGTINGYETANVPRNAIAASSENYRGEIYLQGTYGSAHISSWSPNKITITVNASDHGLVVLNQNYYSGWKVRGDRGRKTEEIDGLLAVRVSPEDERIELHYLPASFVVGLIVTSVTVLLSLIYSVLQIARGRCRDSGVNRATA
jgi:hypothetical protein